jgi:hypothetical protein
VLGALRRGEGDRQPELLVRKGRIEARRHDSDDLDDPARKTQRAPENRRVGAETIAPEAGGEDGHLVATGPVLLAGEGAAEQGPDAEDGEKAARGPRRQHPLGPVSAGEIERRELHGSQLGEAVAGGPQVHEIAHREFAVAASPGLEDHGYPVGVSEGEEPQDDAVDDAENGGGGADPGGKREEGNGGKRRRPRKLAEPVGDVLADLLAQDAPAQPPLRAARDPLVPAAHIAHRAASRRNSAAPVLSPSSCCLGRRWPSRSNSQASGTVRCRRFASSQNGRNSTGRQP